MMFLIGILIQVKRFVDVKQEVIERE